MNSVVGRAVTRHGGRRVGRPLWAVLGAPSLCLAVVLCLLVPASAATTREDLPPALQDFTNEELVALFSSPFEPSSLAAEVARYRAWAPPEKDEVAVCPKLAKVIRKYPGTSDARRAMLDLAEIYLRKGDRKTAEAPFRLVMEVAAGRPEAGYAQARMAESYRYAHVEGLDPEPEWRAVMTIYAGTPPDGLATMLLADWLASKKEFGRALQLFDSVLDRFPDQPYTPYAHLRYALALIEAGSPGPAEKKLEPVFADPAWQGRAYYIRGTIRQTAGDIDGAIADYLRATETGDSVQFRSDAWRHLGDIYAQRGDHRRAAENYRLCLDTLSYREDADSVYLSLLDSLRAEGEYAQAAHVAIRLMMSRLHYDQKYDTKWIEAVLDDCEEHLADQGKEGEAE